MPQMLACKFGRVAAEQEQQLILMLVMLVMIDKISRSADQDFGTASDPSASEPSQNLPAMRNALNIAHRPARLSHGGLAAMAGAPAQRRTHTAAL